MQPHRPGLRGSGGEEKVAHTVVVGRWVDRTRKHNSVCRAMSMTKMILSLVGQNVLVKDSFSVTAKQELKKASFHASYQC